MHEEYSATATSVHAAVMPPTTFGVFLVWYFGLPGSTRSGLNARKTSFPTVRPRSSSFGCMTSRVVPGYVVLSSTASIPGCALRAIASVADCTNRISGSRVLLSGVGTAIEIASQRPNAVSSVVASNRPAFSIAATSAAGTS
jgi:hypothetical protein